MGSSPVEIMNTAIRAKAVGVTTMFSWLANFMIGQVSPVAFERIGKLPFEMSPSSPYHSHGR